MSVIRTDKWLLDSYDKPIELCEKVKEYFDDARASEIHLHLTQHGMYRRPFKNGKELVRKLKENRVWEIVQKEEQQLKKIWDGPNIPIFIFPSDNNREIIRDFNGKSGLAFKDKLFLFISEDNEEKEIRAVFTHEYNHICRLSQLQKNEKDYVLLDTIILEGLAENAIRERFGEEFVGKWTSYYSNKELERIWKKLLLPNKNIRRMDRKHQQMLYGTRFYPKMAGYCVGYYLVKKYMKATSLTCKDLLNYKSNDIAQIKDN